MFVSLEQLQQAVERGKTFSYLLFWGHRPQFPGREDASCLSQWFPAGFEVEGIYYPTAEHYMMAEKARTFHDAEIERSVLQAGGPEEAKKLGRQIARFDNQVWEQYRFDVVVRGNIAKFTQNEGLRQYLISTGSKILAEASPIDEVWGIGLSARDSDAYNPLKWRGLNLLGFALMAVRVAIVSDVSSHVAVDLP